MVAQADQSRRAVRAGAVFGVLLVARLLSGAAGFPQSSGLWSLPALLIHDILVALLFWFVDRVAARPRWLWLAYAIIAFLAAVNVPIVRVVGASLTVPMLRAARGPILDSIRAYVSASNLLAIALVITAAAALPTLLKSTPVRVRRAALILGAALLAVVPFTGGRPPTAGAQRNVVTALGSTLWPRVSSAEGRGSIDWRVSPFGEAAAETALAYRNAGKGFNILLIVLESTAAQYLKPYGAADDPMPTVSELASRSLVIDGTYSPYPESIRALFSWGCSRSPAFDTSAEQLALSDCSSLPIQLSRAGYRTALYHSGRFAYLGMTETMALLKFEHGVDAGGISGRIESSFGVDEPSTVARMLEWIDHDPSKPFFLTYMPTAGHHPYASSGPGPFPQTDDLSAFKNAIHEGDAAIGTLLAGVHSRGLASRTIVVVTGDHGEAFGQHSGNFAHSFYIYDENIRVPLIFHVPGRAPQKLNRVSSLIDLAPTLLDIAGVQAFDDAEGVSLLDGQSRMALFFTDYAVGWLGLRDGCLKYLFEVEARRSHLYNLCEDPAEKNDIVDGADARVEAYRERVERWAEARRRDVLAAGRQR